MVYVSAVTYLLLNRYCYLLPVRSLCAIFVYSRDIPQRTKTLTSQTAKYHSAEMGDTLRRSSTAIPRLAALKAPVY